MTDLPPDFRDLLVELHEAGADFVVVGGYAVGFHALSRLEVRVAFAIPRHARESSAGRAR